MRLPLHRYRKITFLTGAGISVASGIRPFRGPGGIWTEEQVEYCGTAQALQRDPAAVWGLFGPLREVAAKAEPNAAHLAIKAFQDRFAGIKEVCLITQNVDRLHQRAGSTDTIEIHGTLFRTRCRDCDLEPFEDYASHTEELPLCPSCGGPLRIDAILFNEPLNSHTHWQARRAIEGCHLFIGVGTSGLVRPASTFARQAKMHGADTVLCNLEPMRPRNPYFDRELLGKAEELLPEILGPNSPLFTG